MLSDGNHFSPRKKNPVVGFLKYCMADINYILTLPKYLENQVNNKILLIVNISKIVL